MSGILEPHSYEAQIICQEACARLQEMADATRATEEAKQAPHLLYGAELMRVDGPGQPGYLFTYGGKRGNVVMVEGSGATPALAAAAFDAAWIGAKK